jgi:alkylation response protein AidB-like acyl-CoA dehydrogenase
VGELEGNLTDYISALEHVALIARENATLVDEGNFPKATIDALRETGLLGLISAESVGGMGQGPRAAATVVERIARECGSSAMVTCMHYSGVAVIEQYGTESTRKDIAAGRHLSTLAFSEAGSRSHFWAPLSSATRTTEGIQLNAHKSWVTSASHATAFVWSSQPIEAEGPSTIWLVPGNASGLSKSGPFTGLGMRGNNSTPITASNVLVNESTRLGEDGAGFGIMMETVLPWFQLMNAACSIGLMEGATSRACEHAAGSRYAHMDSTLADLPTIRNYLARMRIKTDMTRSLWLDTLNAMETGREDTMLRVLEVKAAAGETATEVLDIGMRVCGGAAFRSDVAVERYFRDARAATIMAPTTDVLYDFIGKAVCGMDLF